jgi:anti-sigma factor ChrR (cupin superfamily)
MLVNADFSRPVIIPPDAYRWIPSPQTGVERMMLDRLGAEKARATSIVRYAPASYFPLHAHPGGEEIFVLSGVFSDESGDYPAGSYLRNPPGSAHKPHTANGAIIFVKLWQMDASDLCTVRLDTNVATAWRRSASREICPLFSRGAEQVALHRLDANRLLFEGPIDTAELLVTRGTILANGRRYQRGTWIRLPAGEWPDLIAGDVGACVYLKTGHLPRVESKA